MHWLVEGATREWRAEPTCRYASRALTRVLLELGLSVCSIEPDEKMLYQLLASAARATGVVGRVEALPLSDNSIDTVTVGQAWHWFEPETVARVVRPPTSP